MREKDRELNRRRQRREKAVKKRTHEAVEAAKKSQTKKK